MNFVDALKSYFANYANFSGRSRRSAYWWPFLAVFIVDIITQVISPYLYYVFVLAVFVPGLAVGIRRMHDVGKSGWFILIPIYDIVLACQDSQPGDNQYGPSPKGGGYAPPSEYGTPPPGYGTPPSA